MNELKWLLIPGLENYVINQDADDKAISRK